MNPSVWRATPSDNRLQGTMMTKVLGFIGATIGGWIGWAVGAPVGIFTAFAVSMVGTGVGLYYGRRAAQHWL